MSRTTFIQFVLLLMLAPVVTAWADCPETPDGTHLYLGVDRTIPVSISLADPSITEEPWSIYIDKLDLLRVQVVWVPRSSDSRYKDQHIIDIDWVQQTHTNVDVWDGELQQISIRDLHPVLLEINTDFETGQVHLVSCNIYHSAGPVLLFAHYGYEGRIFPDFTRVSPVVGGNGAKAVTNSAISSAISGIFNNYLDRHMIEDVELSTGVKPGHYLAQSFLFQNLDPFKALLRETPSLFFDANNAIVKHNRVYVTGDEASARVPLSLAGVFSGDVDIMSNDKRVRNLEQYIGLVQFQSRFSNLRGGYNQIIEARPNVTIETQTCVDGQSVLIANFTHPSEVPGEILVYLGDSPGAMNRGPSLYEGISCDYDYWVEGIKKFEGEKASTGKIFVPVATAGG